MKLYLRLLKFLKPHLWIFGLAVICMLGASLLGGVSMGAIIPMVQNILSPQGITIPNTDSPFISEGVTSFIVNLINKINSIDRKRFLNWFCLWMVVLFFLKSVFECGSTLLMNSVSLKVNRDIKNKLYEKILSLSLGFYGQGSSGELVSRITYDTSVIQNSISEGLKDIVRQSFEVLVCLTVVFGIRKLFNISWSTIGLGVILLPTVIYPVIRIGRRLRKISRQSQENMGDINTTLFETVSGISVVKAFCLEPNRWQKFKEHNQKCYKLAMKICTRDVSIGPLTELVLVSCGSVILWMLGKEVVDGNLDSGALIAFLAAFLALGKPVKKLGRVNAIIQKALAAGKRIFDILDRPCEIVERPDAVIFEDMQTDIVFKDVQFKYETEVILKNINLRAAQGQIIAIVGTSGAGKTTLVNLIPRFYDPIAGSVEIDGRDIREFTLKSLRDKIGLVTQETILFNDTVAANIGFGSLDAGQGKIEEAACLANCHDFIQKMPLKYKTVIGERGFRLSGGQRQRLAIARAILKNPPILILDEATSQLDSESENLVREAIEKLMNNRTVFVIAHRLSTIRHADNIVLLDHSRIKNTGRHEELIDKDPLYKKLYESQFTI